MQDRHAAGRAVEAVQSSPGETSSALRASLSRGESTEPAIVAYLEFVRDVSYQITPQVVPDLLERGWSEDAVFEVSIVAAVDEASRRLDAALQALERAPEDRCAP